MRKLLTQDSVYMTLMHTDLFSYYTIYHSIILTIKVMNK